MSGIKKYMGKCFMKMNVRMVASDKNTTGN